MTLYGLRTCDTCRKALREIRAAGHAVELVDVRDTPPDAATLDRFAAAFGERIVNTRSATWRGLSAEDRAAGPRAVVAAHPAAMKRPVIEDGATLYLGWDAAVRSALL